MLTRLPREPGLYDLPSTFYGVPEEAYEALFHGVSLEETLSKLPKASDTLYVPLTSEEPVEPSSYDSMPSPRPSSVYDTGFPDDKASPAYLEAMESSALSFGYTTLAATSEESDDEAESTETPGQEKTAKNSVPDWSPTFSANAKLLSNDDYDKELEKLRSKIRAYTNILDKKLQLEPKSWTLRFHRLLYTMKGNFNDASAHEAVKGLITEFSEVATSYCKLIISEKNLPFEEKTIKPSDSGGVAGGEKYIHNGILFKFALDAPVNKSFMYGGFERSDEKAMKAAGREMHGYRLFTTLMIPKISFPLMCVINYKGFRVIASALLPLSKGSLVYGSDDAGRTVHADNQEINGLMSEAASNLGLRPHWVGKPDTGKLLAMPGDIEAHKGSDGRYYILDFARVCPPEAPPLDKTKRLADPRAVFYKLLRGELIRRPQVRQLFPSGLSSDAFTGWSFYDKHRGARESDVRKVTELLHTSIIPEFAAQLDEELCSPPDGEVFTRKSRLKIPLKFIASSALHEAGINMRHLGKIRQHVKRPKVIKTIISEAVARTLKNQSRTLLRELMEKVENTSEEPFKRPLIDFLNRITHKYSQEWFENTIVPDLCLRFEGILTDAERKLPLSSIASIPMVVLRLVKMLGIRIRSKTMRLFLGDSEGFWWVPKDISSLEASCDYPFWRDNSEAYMHFLTLSDRLTHDGDWKISDKDRRHLKDARRAAQAALGIAPGCPVVSAVLGVLKLVEGLSSSTTAPSRWSHDGCLFTDAVKLLSSAALDKAPATFPSKVLTVALVKLSENHRDSDPAKAEALANEARGRWEEAVARGPGRFLPDLLYAGLWQLIERDWLKVDAQFRRQSVVGHVQEYPYEHLLGRHPENWPSDVDPARREEFLAVEEFERMFKMSRKAFGVLPFWRKKLLKQELDLF